MMRYHCGSVLCLRLWRSMALACLALCSHKAPFITGVTLAVDGGLWLRSARALAT